MKLTTMPLPPRLPALIALFIFALGLILALSAYPALLDDAYITYRYADHYAAGKGIAYNAVSLGLRCALWIGLSWMLK